MSTKQSLVSLERIERRIVVIRGRMVLLDGDVARLYGVTAKRLNEQVKRNRTRFPADFMFQLTKPEYALLRSQIATLDTGRGKHRKYLPYAFTEHGAIMVATVLNSPNAVDVSILVVRAFVRLREILTTNQELAQRIAQLEQTAADHNQAIVSIFQLLNEPAKDQIGFVLPEQPPAE